MPTEFLRKIENLKEYIPLIKKESSVAIIPARAGSKSIKNKNIKELNGIPLLSHSIRHGLNSKFISDVYVSSDSSNILEISEKFGAKTVLRPKELSNDFIHPEPAIIHTLLEFVKREKYLPECTVLLQPTSPIRDTDKIDAAIKDVFSGKYNSSIAATRTHHFIWEKDESNNWVAPYGESRPRRQDFFQVRETGSFFSFSSIKFLEFGDRIIKPVNLQITSEVESYEIDTPCDWIILEALIKNKNYF